MAEQHKNTSDYLIQGLSFILVVLPVSWIFSIFYIILSPIAVFLTKLKPVVDELYRGMKCSRYITESHRGPVRHCFRFIKEKIIKLILEKYVDKYLRKKETEIVMKDRKDKEGRIVDKQKTVMMKMRPFLSELQDLWNELNEMKVEVKKYLKERKDKVMNKNLKNKEDENVDKKLTDIMEKIKLKKGNIIETKDKVFLELMDQKLKIIRPFLLYLQNMQDELKEMKMVVKKNLKADEVLKKDHMEKEIEMINEYEAGVIDLKEKGDKDDDNLTDVKVEVMDKYLNEKEGRIIDKYEAVEKYKKGARMTLLIK